MTLQDETTRERLETRDRLDLDVLRGWHEVVSPGFSRAHALPALARLVRCDGGEAATYAIHGPELYVGRFHPQHGPVDLVLTNLHDHEIYKLSAPHIRLTLEEHGGWSLRPMTPVAPTQVNGETVDDTRRAHPIGDGDVITLGVTTFRFEQLGVTFDQWLEHKRRTIVSVERPALFLMRAGGVCGPYFVLDPERTNVVGRSFPGPGELRARQWEDVAQPDWNLAGLQEHEKKFVGFRHVAMTHDGEGWNVEPLTMRQRTFVNRVEIASKTPLMPGDELGLGSVLFHFHDPLDIEASTQSRTAELPAVVNWQEEHTSPRVQPLPPDASAERPVFSRDDDEDDKRDPNDHQPPDETRE